jgi:hypothetical protein
MSIINKVVLKRVLDVSQKTFQYQYPSINITFLSDLLEYTL